MRQSLFVSTLNRSDVGRKDWWPLEILIDAARRAIDITSKYGRHFARPPELVPVVYVKCIEDLRRVGEHAKALIALLDRQNKALEQITMMPGILAKRPKPDVTFEVLIDAAERFKDAGTVARQIAGGCFQSVVCDPAVALADPGLKFIVNAWNASLLKLAESYVTHVEGIPDELERILLNARAGEVKHYQIHFNMNLDTEPIFEAVEVRRSLNSGEFSFPWPHAGRIYALLNPSMPGLVKIGKTTRCSESRALELHTTGVPTPFIVLYEVDVADCDEAEHYIHQLLAEFRVVDNREFFRVEPKIAVDAMAAIQLRYTSPS